MSRESLEDHLQSAVTAVAYPFGKPRRHFTQGTLQAARVAGFDKGVAVVTRGIRPADDVLALPRIVVDGDDLATLEGKVMGHWDFLGWWQERAPLPLVRLLRPGEFDEA